MQGLEYHSKAFGFYFLHILPKYYYSWFFSTTMLYLSETWMLQNRGPQNVVPRPITLVSLWEFIKNANR